MKSDKQMEQTLADAHAVTGVEGIHRRRLKQELLNAASTGKETMSMQSRTPRRVLAYAVCTMLILVASGASTTYVWLHWNTGRPVITQEEPVAVAQQVLEALQKNDFSLIEGVFPSKKALASVFPADKPFVAKYDELQSKLKDEFEQCLADFPDIASGKLVRLDGDYAERPSPLDSSKTVGIFDNAHIFVQIGDMVYDIKIDELIEIDGAWYLIELPGKYGAQPPKPIADIR